MSVFKYNTNLSKLADGDHSFEVINAETGLSKKGKDMLILTLKVIAENGAYMEIKDFFVDNNIFKLYTLLKSSGKKSLFTGKNEPHEFVGLRGRVKIGTKENPGYSPQKVIDSYLFEEKASQVESESPEKFDDDDVPF